MKITFDPVESADTAERRGFGFDVVTGFDGASALHAVDDRRACGEVREVAVGPVGGTILAVASTRRGDALHIIPVRRADREERDRHAQA